MAPLSHGQIPKKRAKLLFEALLSYAARELKDWDDNISKNFKCDWRSSSDNEIIVEATLITLQTLLKTHFAEEFETAFSGKNPKDDIRNAIHNLEKFLEILKDLRGEKDMGSPDWKFLIEVPLKKTNDNYNLGNLDEYIERNLTEFDRKWESKKNPNRQPSGHNLPEPDYSKFIGREDQLKQLKELIAVNRPQQIIEIIGMAGIGKTALVLKAAWECWENKQQENKSESNTSTFDAIIYTSAKSSPVKSKQQATTLSGIFRIISKTLDNTGITQAAIAEQLEKVKKSLSKQRTLLIIENIEALAQEEQKLVKAFLDDLPNDTKSIVTTRQQLNWGYSISLDFLSEPKSLELLEETVKQKDMKLNEEQRQSLCNHCYGLPYALILFLGRIASSSSADKILEKLEKSTSLPEDLAHLCEDSVEPLREKPAHKLLLSLAIFQGAAVRNALAEVAGLKGSTYSVDHGLEQLNQLCLIRLNKEKKYEILHPLTRQFAEKELAKYPDFEKESRERWLKYYKNLACHRGGNDWRDWYQRYDCLEKEWDNLHGVIEWCCEEERYKDVLDLWGFLNQYASLYGYWGERIHRLQWLKQQAMLEQDWKTMVYSLSELSFTYVRKVELDKAEELLNEAQELPCDEREKTFLNQHMALLRIHQERYQEAQSLLDEEQTLANKAEFTEKERTRRKIAITFLRAEIFYKTEKFELAEEFYNQVVKESTRIGWQRKANYAQNYLADIAIHQGDLDKAEKLLKKGLPIAETNKDKWRIACYKKSFADLKDKRGELSKSSDYKEQSDKIFEELRE